MEYGGILNTQVLVTVIFIEHKYDKIWLWLVLAQMESIDRTLDVTLDLFL